MAKHPSLSINPDVFRWAITGSGWNEEELSKKTGIKLKSIQEWWHSSAPIRIVDLKKISKVIKRPVSVLLLPEPPVEKELPYYRRVSGTDSTTKPSKKILEIVRRAKYVQDNANEMLEMLSEDVKPDIISQSLQVDPERIADAEREAFGLNLQRHYKDEKIDDFVRNAYESLREKIETLNIFVMQLPMNIEDARGFSLAYKYPYMIVISSKDQLRSKLFTLLHEYAHLLLKTDGICLADPDHINEQNNEQGMVIEKWCNNFAGAFIMPRKAMLTELEDMSGDTPNRVVDSLANKFCASKTAITIRILNLLANDPRLKGYHEYYKTIPVSVTKKSKSGRGGRNMAKECIGHNGKKYVRLVTESRKRELITIHDMVMYLDLKTKHFEKLEGMI